MPTFSKVTSRRFALISIVNASVILSSKSYFLMCTFAVWSRLATTVSSNTVEAASLCDARRG